MKRFVLLFFVLAHIHYLGIACPDGNLLREQEINSFGFGPTHFFYQLSFCGVPASEIYSVKLEPKVTLQLEKTSLTALPVSLKTETRVVRGAVAFEFSHGLRVAADSIVTGASLKRIQIKTNISEFELMLLPEEKIFNKPFLPPAPPAYASWKFPSWTLKEKGDSDLSRTIQALRRRIYPVSYNSNSQLFYVPATSDISSVLFRSSFFRGQIQNLLDGIATSPSLLEWHNGWGRLGGEGRIQGAVPEEMLLDLPDRVWLYSRDGVYAAKRHGSAVSATIYINAPPSGSLVCEGTASVLYESSLDDRGRDILFAIGSDSDYRLSARPEQYKQEPVPAIRNPLLPLVNLTQHVPRRSFSNSNSSIRFLETETEHGETRFFVWDGDRRIAEINEMVKEAFWDKLISWEINDGRYVLFLSRAGSDEDGGDVLWVLDRKNWAISKLGALAWETRL